MLITKSAFKLILVLSNYLTCTFPLRQSIPLVFGTVWFFQLYANVDIYNKTNLYNFISKGDSIFEILLIIWSGYVHAGRIIHNWNIHSEKQFMQKRFSSQIELLFESVPLKPHWKGIVSQKLYTFLPSKF